MFPKADANVTFIKGRITTCNLLTIRILLFYSSRIKVINQNWQLPAQPCLEFEGVPCSYLAALRHFPLSQKRHSGFLPANSRPMPSTGLGFEGIGYYKVINRVLGRRCMGMSIPTAGWSFNVNLPTSAATGIGFIPISGLLNTKMNFKGDPDYFRTRAIPLPGIILPIAGGPGVSFSAHVNASSTKYNKYVPNSPQINFQSLLVKSITHSKTTSAYNLTVSANHSQNNQTRLVNLSLPDIGFFGANGLPLQSREGGKTNGISNWVLVTAVRSGTRLLSMIPLLSCETFSDTIQWGAQHSVPISLSLPPIMGGAIMLAPSVSYSQVWISQKLPPKLEQRNKQAGHLHHERALYRPASFVWHGHEHSLIWKYNFHGSRVSAIRHVVRAHTFAQLSAGSVKQTFLPHQS